MSRLLSSPAFDVRPKPELDSALPEIEDGPWHILVALLVLEDGVPVRQTEDFGYTLRIDQVFRSDSRSHELELTSLGGCVRGH